MSGYAIVLVVCSCVAIVFAAVALIRDARERRHTREQKVVAANALARLENSRYGSMDLAGANNFVAKLLLELSSNDAEIVAAWKPRARQFAAALAYSRDEIEEAYYNIRELPIS